MNPILLIAVVWPDVGKGKKSMDKISMTTLSRSSSNGNYSSSKIGGGSERMSSGGGSSSRCLSGQGLNYKRTSRFLLVSIRG